MLLASPSSFRPSSAHNAESSPPSTHTRNFSDTLDHLRRDCLKDPLQWRQGKLVNQKNPCWIQEELRETGLPSNTEEYPGAHHGTSNGSHHGAQKGEERGQGEATNTGHNNQPSSQPGTVDSIILGSVLKTCSEQKDLFRGSRIHAEIVKHGLFEKNVFLGSSLVNFYCKCGAIDIAERVFDELPVRSIVSWNALIGGYSQHMHNGKAVASYIQMQNEGFSPNNITFLSVLKACGTAVMADENQVLHAEIVKAGFLEDTRISTALVDMYAKCGVLEQAEQVFMSLNVRDVVLWTALILGYAQYEDGEEALLCYEQMQLEGLIPDALTWACILKACGSIGVAYEGQKIHAELVRHEILEKDMVAGSALVDMYANCGMLVEAQQVFDSLRIKNVVAWSALMEGYAQLGKEKVVFCLFDSMIKDRAKPTWVTFTILLNACCHGGLLDKGMESFERISKEHTMAPTIEHYTCMVDLFCRAGHLEKAIVMIKEMPIPANLALWKTLLDAFQKWGNMMLGRWTFERVLELDEKDAAAFVCLSNFPGRQKAWVQGHQGKYEKERFSKGSDGVLSCMV